MKLKIEDVIVVRDAVTELEKKVEDISHFSLVDASRETGAAFVTAVHLYADQEMRFFRCADNFIHVTNQSQAERGMLFAAEYVYTFSQDESIDSERPQGWKFHVRVDDSNPDDHNLERSWPIMLEKLKEHHVTHAKVIRDDARDQFRKHPEQHYKTYTIYAYADPRPAQEWLPVIADIEAALLKAQIKPSVLPEGEALGGRELVANSQFFSCRDDRVDREKTVNPSEYVSTNPYHDFDIGPLLAKKQSTVTTSTSSSSSSSDKKPTENTATSNDDAAPQRPQLKRTHAERQLQSNPTSSNSSKLEPNIKQEKSEQNNTENQSCNLAKKIKNKFNKLINHQSKSANNEKAGPEETSSNKKLDR